MPTMHQAIVLRTVSVSRNTLILLDEKLGKIEGIAFAAKNSPQLSHGALISYTLKKRGMKFLLCDVQLLDLPLYWARENFLFFHHVLELCDYFVSWGQHSGVFELLNLLYTTPEAVNTAETQKVFLRHFFKHLGMHPELEDERIEVWLRACLNDHPRSAELQTTGFLTTVGLNEEFA